MLMDFPPQLLFSSSEKILGGISVKIHHISENVKKRNPEKLTRNTSKKQGLLSIDVKTTKQNLKRFRREISRGETLEKISEKKPGETLKNILWYPERNWWKPPEEFCNFSAMNIRRDPTGNSGRNFAKSSQKNWKKFMKIFYEKLFEKSRKKFFKKLHWNSWRKSRRNPEGTSNGIPEGEVGIIVDL